MSLAPLLENSYSERDFVQGIPDENCIICLNPVADENSPPEVACAHKIHQNCLDAIARSNPDPKCGKCNTPYWVDVKCSICLEPFAEGEVVFTPHCDTRHRIHEICRQNLFQNAEYPAIGQRCPTCRTPFEGEDPVEAEIGAPEQEDGPVELEGINALRQEAPLSFLHKTALCALIGLVVLLGACFAIAVPFGSAALALVLVYVFHQPIAIAVIAGVFNAIFFGLLTFASVALNLRLLKAARLA